jgi:predicted  nucleic acid-binding Zn-ribbon protein
MKQLCVLFLTVILASGCENFKTQYEQASREKDSLLTLAIGKEAAIDSFISSFTEIEANLDNITQKQNMITSQTKNSIEFSRDAKQRINESIQAINELMEKNKSELENLKKKLKGSNARISSLEKMIASLQEQIVQKDAELANLNSQLLSLNKNIDSLHVFIDTITADNTTKSQIISDQTSKLHTAYYVVGTYKELRDKNVLNKEGGFLGLGKEQKLKPDFNNEVFTRVDFTQLATIPVNTKGAKILTNHPSDSYRIDGDKKMVKSLMITDAEKFWKVSKYLVIVTN